MPKNLPFAIARAVLATAIVVVVFFTSIYATTFQRDRLALLSLQQPNIAGFSNKAETQGPTDQSTSPVAAIKAAAKADPHHTGVYSSIWNGVDKSNASAVLTIDVLPTAAEAKSAYTDTGKTFFSPAAEKTYDKIVRFTPKGFPNAEGADLHNPKTSTDVASETEVVLFRQNNIVVLSVLGGSINVDRASNIGLASREYAVIKKNGPGFTMFVRGHPGGWSTLYFFCGALFILFSFGGMYWIRSAREQQAERQAALARYHYTSRGSKALKRKAPIRRH